jgi:diguanylate cyclase (GGDEF)-like protein/PAS domain S-box-containing protein
MGMLNHGMPSLIVFIRLSVGFISGSVIFALTRRVKARAFEAEVLRMNEFRFREVQRIARIGHWEYEVKSKRIHWSEELYRVYRIDPGTPPRSLKEHMEMYPAADRALLRLSVDRALKEGAPYDLELQVRGGDGELLEVHLMGHVVRGDTGQVIRVIGTSRDITERKRTQRALRESEEQFRTAFDQAAIGMTITSTDDGKFLRVNPAFCEMTGYTEDELLRLKFRDITHPEDLESSMSLLATIRISVPSGLEKRYVRKDGRCIWVRLTVSPVRDEEKDTPRHFLGLMEDITGLKQAQENARLNEERWQLALQGTSDGIFDFDVKTGAVFYSPRWKEMLGYTDSELRDESATWEELVHPDDLALAQNAVDSHLSGKTDGYEAEYRIRCRDGEYKWIHARGRVLRDSKGTPLRLVGVHTDVTNRKRTEARLAFDADHDPLTSLANRRLFQERLESEIQISRATESDLCLCICDLDHFKQINDAHGHGAGDGALIAFSELLQSLLRRRDFAGRIGGDEFCVLLPQTSVREASECMTRVREGLETLALGSEEGVVFSITASLGIAALQKSMDASKLMEAADFALYEAKKFGRNRLYALAP